jgi:hypothetical protein
MSSYTLSLEGLVDPWEGEVFRTSLESFPLDECRFLSILCSIII